MSPAAGTMSDAMAKAVRSYAEGKSRCLATAAKRHGVSVNGLSLQINKLGLNRYGDTYKGWARKSAMKGKIGAEHPRWNGGQCLDHQGYVLTTDRKYPHLRNNPTAQIKEHIRLMELHLGRQLLPDECVHHKDLNRRNNEFSNLELMTKSAHSRLHARLRWEKRAARLQDCATRATLAPAGQEM